MKRLADGASRLQSKTTWSVLAICVVAGLALVPPGSAAVNALIVGKVLDCGGPAPGHCSVQDHSVVSAYNSRHRLVARETVNNGHFAFVVRPGRFKLVASCDTFAAPANCRRSRWVTAKAGKTVHANIVVGIKR